MDVRHAFIRARLKLIRAAQGGVAAARKEGVVVGSNCRIYSYEFGTEPWLISIGDRVTLSSRVSLLTHDGSGWLMRDESGRRYNFGRIDIGNDVFIGLGAIIMPGVRIGDNCIVGAGSVVTKSIPSGSVVAGNPARLIGSYEDQLLKMKDWPSEADVDRADYRRSVENLTPNSHRNSLV